VIWCLCPCASSLSNGLGLYDGVSAAFAQTVTWGFPYFIGRLYLGDLEGLRELALGIFYGGLVYVPLCLFEIRMSPQLHRLLYGYHANDFAQTVRFGGWRPTVFMDHGLMVGMWMSMSALIGLWLWSSRSLGSVLGVPQWILAVILLITAILCKSMGALILLLLGLMALVSLQYLRARHLVWLLIAVAPLYIALRASKSWDGAELQQVSELVSKDRTQSLKFRLFNENLLVAKALERPVFGWGGWGRSQIIDKKNNFRTVVDGMWINVLGLYGFVGLISSTLVLLLPPALLLWRMPAGVWSSPAFATAAALLVVNILYMIDNLPNAMVNPIYTLSAGALAGILAYRAPSSEAVIPSMPRLPRGVRATSARPVLT
jgi:hypothetical protein